VVILNVLIDCVHKVVLDHQPSQTQVFLHNFSFSRAH